MAFSIRDYQDMVRLLDRHPEWRAELRRLVLTEELLALPAIVRDLAEAQQRTEARLEQLAVRVDQLAEAQQRTEVLVQGLSAEMRLLSRQVQDLLEWQRGEAGRRDGERYEQRVIRRAGGLFNGGEGGSPGSDKVYHHLLSLIRRIPNLKNIGEDEDPMLADLIWWKDHQYAVIEVSITADKHDVTRAARRAEALRSANVQAIAVVFAEAWAASEVRYLAEDYDVQWRVGNDLSEGYLAFCGLEV